MEFIITPNGKLVNIAGGKTPVLNGQRVDYGDVSEYFNSPEAAQAYYSNLITQAKTQGLASDLRTAATVSWSSMGTTPNPGSNGNPFTFLINGSSFGVFLATGVMFKFDDGTKSVSGCVGYLASDTQIYGTSGGQVFPEGGIYSVYYSTDGGVTYQPTGSPPMEITVV